MYTMNGKSPADRNLRNFNSSGSKNRTFEYLDPFVAHVDRTLISQAVHENLKLSGIIPGFGKASFGVEDFVVKGFNA